MALILVAMRQAARSGVYQVFFPSTEVKRFVSNDTRSVATLTNAEDASAEISPALQSALDTWAAQKTSDELASLLANWLDGQPWGVQDDSTGALAEPGNEAAIAQAIQRKLIAEMRDGTVWRADDGPGLMATLALHDPRKDRPTPPRSSQSKTVAAGVLPLLQQPDVYRGKSVRARGEVVQIEKLRASENPFGITSYWNLWLLPQDASNRPWLVIVGELPSELAALIPTSTSTPEAEQQERLEAESDKRSWPVNAPRPLVDVDGEFLKRLSYQSAAGAELTPVVAGHVVTIQANGNSRVATAIGASQPSASAPADRPDELPLFWIVVGSIAAGFLIAIAVMWRTATLNRQMRARRNRHPVSLGIVWIVTGIMVSSSASAQSLMDLLPGYDQERLQELSEAAVSTLASPSIDVDEIAKIVFRVNRLSDAALQTRVARSSMPPSVGDAIVIDEEISELTPLTIDADLQEYLEFEQIQMVRLADVEGVPHLLFAKLLPGEAVPGDRIACIAVRTLADGGKGNRGSSAALAASQGSDPASQDWIIDIAGRLHWTPARPQSPADAVLALSGVDLSRLADLPKRDREPFDDADSPLFYPMIGAADFAAHPDREQSQRSDAARSMRDSTIDVSPVDLLQDPATYTGQWIQLDAETIRITRVAVESSQRQIEVGGDSYYEIDAIGDLGQVELKIEVPGEESVTMANRYPVTIVTARLPDFLQPDESEGTPLVITRTVPIRVEGFFYRLWSYESDFMQSRGAKQFAPLIIAGVIADQRPDSTDPMGVQAIGNIAAIAVVGAILAAIVFGVVTRRGDRRSRGRTKRQ
ncbi:hypothetical protein [Allorhodopirellula solitaria]|nr:hypothetical protein [Allorhodopirellula solitaria]